VLFRAADAVPMVVKATDRRHGEGVQDRIRKVLLRSGGLAGRLSSLPASSS